MYEILLPLVHDNETMQNDFIYTIYRDKRTVFNLQEIALLMNEADRVRLKQRIHYYVKTGKLKNIRKGIYAKDNYSAEELACKIYTPAYISLEYVLQQSGIIFQYSDQLTLVSYLSRIIQVDGRSLQFRKIRNEIIVDTNGITMTNEGVNIACPERAFTDMLYLNKEFSFDVIHGLNKELINTILPIYQSNRLLKQVKEILKNA